MSFAREEVAPGIDPAAIVDRIIKTRFATRRFSPAPLAREMVEDILEVARFAPSGANIQPWRAYVVAGSLKDELSLALLRAHDEQRDDHVSEYQYYAVELPEPYLARRATFGRLFYGSLDIAQTDLAARASQTAKNYGFFGAPVGLILTIDRRLAVGSWLDFGMFVQNIMIAAGARGVRSCPQETFAKYHKVLRTFLPVGSDEIVVCGVSLGFAAADSDGGLMPREPVKDFATFHGFEP